jgi:hypothetical protein
MRLSTSIIAISALVVVQAKCHSRVNEDVLPSLLRRPERLFYLHFFDPRTVNHRTPTSAISTPGSPNLDHHTNYSSHHSEIPKNAAMKKKKKKKNKAS